MNRTLLCGILLLWVTGLRAQAWTELGSGPTALHANAFPSALCADARGIIYVSGFFTDPNGRRNVYQWDGNTWSTVGSGSKALNANGVIYTLCTDRRNHLFAAGYFYDGNGKRQVMEWDGDHWQQVGNLDANAGIEYLRADTLGNLYAAGIFRNAALEYYVARWDGHNWTELGAGSTVLNRRSSFAITVTPGGKVYALNKATTAYRLYCWDNNAWTRMFADSSCDYLGLTHNPQGPFSLRYEPTESVMAGWNGNNMQRYPLGQGGGYTRIDIDENSLCSDQYGNIYLAGDGYVNSAWKFYIARWDGQSWTELLDRGKPLMLNGHIETLCTDPSGNVYIAGRFTNQQGYNCVYKYTPPEECYPYVFPNPARTTIQVACIPEHTTVYVTDVADRLLFNRPLDKDRRIEIGHLPPGVYFLRSRRGTVKFLKLP